MSLALRVLGVLGVVASPVLGQAPGVVEPPPPLIEVPLDLTLEAPTLESMGSGATFEDRVMELVNEERWANGQLPPLKRQDDLERAAEGHSQRMAEQDFFAHCDLVSGLQFFERIQNEGYFGSVGENIAAGQSTPESVMSTWMNSSGHRANILNTGFRELGIGYFLQSNDQGNIDLDNNGNCVADSVFPSPLGHYWTQNFGGRSSVYPVVIEREAFETSSRNVDLYLYGASWAQEMRLRNENGLWTPWMTFATNVAWQLSDGDGTKTVNVELRNGTTVRSASDTIELTGQGPANEIFSDGFESGNMSAWSQTVP